MPIYKKEPSGKFVPFEKTPFVDLEKVLEDWIESNPHLLLEGEDLVVIARQPRTAFGKYLDLLAIDETGATVVVELKRGETPRDVVAQALEYASWVDGLSVEHLDDMTRDYSGARSGTSRGIEDVYREAFEDAEEDDLAEEGVQPGSSRIAFNHRQRIVIVAEHISDEVEQTLRYLRARMGADVYGIEFSVHSAGGDTLVSTTMVVGRESSTAPRAPGRAKQETDEDTLGRVKSDFLRNALPRIERWPSDIAGLTVKRAARGSDRMVFFQGTKWIGYYFAANWIYIHMFWMEQEELDLLRSRLENPNTIRARGKGKNARFHLTTESDLALLKELIESRVARKQTSKGDPT